ncbi:hypothetical protein E0W48_06610 [Neisseria meningitidis]|nr:hypothetical protein [Neisseria meningitidis]MBG8811450.1 hypothetical protein [Neisseria meningitidis]MBG8813504.1 hypothetical protein [Neisseria meningitidis]MBJ7828409.1 hypothetical protein [Neisseria meningitidis]
MWITLSVFSGKFLKLKISSFLQKQKTKIRNLKFVIPAKVGIQDAESQETVLSDKRPHRQVWIPACAGMTGFEVSVFVGMTGCRFVGMTWCRFSYGWIRHSRAGGNLERKI